MHRSLLFRFFPPPSFLIMPHAGLDIADDAIRCIEYRHTGHRLTISKYATQALPAGLVSGGEIRDEREFVSILGQFAAQYGLSYVKASLPEEKTYLFQTEVPSADFRSIAQNIESKLDQNIPLSAADALFQFDLMPESLTGDTLRASVSVVPRSYIERSVALFREAGLIAVAFEGSPKSIVAAYMPKVPAQTHLIVHVTKGKAGLYIASEGVVCFTSTVSIDPDNGSHALIDEIGRAYAYWMSRSDMHSAISEIVVVGLRAEEYESLIRNHHGDPLPHSMVPDVWGNIFDVNAYLPPISRAESFEYAVAAGLAL